MGLRVPVGKAEGPRVRMFADAGQLRAWFELNHGRARELWIGYYKKGVGKTAVSYPAALEEALCFGWIDGQLRSIDDERYANRYTPRRPGSRWSQTNVAKVRELRRAGRMRPSGLKAFRERDPDRPAGYSYEDRPKVLAPPLAREFRGHPCAWKYFLTQPPSYRRTITFWVMSGQRDETRRRRLGLLVQSSQREERMDLLRPGASKPSRRRQLSRTGGAGASRKGRGPS